MKTMNTQRGMTLTSFLTVLIVVGFFLYIGMKLFPMYQEYYAVRSAMKSLANEPGVGSMEPADPGSVLQAPVHQLLGKREAGQREVRPSRQWLDPQGQLRSAPSAGRQPGCGWQIRFIPGPDPKRCRINLSNVAT